MGREEARLLEEIGRCAVGSMVYSNGDIITPKTL
jgi:hypothetical protein